MFTVICKLCYSYKTICLKLLTLNIYGLIIRFNNSTFEGSINHTNDLYGGFNPSVTNVYFSHGSLDPWHRMGVLSDLNEHSPSAVIEGWLAVLFLQIKYQL